MPYLCGEEFEPEYASQRPDKVVKANAVNLYAAEFFAKCPGNGARVKYTLEIQTTAMVMVEQINDVLLSDRFREGYHEAFADHLADVLPGRQTLRAFHHGVQIETTREGNP